MPDTFAIALRVLEVCGSLLTGFSLLVMAIREGSGPRRPRNP